MVGDDGGDGNDSDRVEWLVVMMMVMTVICHTQKRNTCNIIKGSNVDGQFIYLNG